MCACKCARVCICVCVRERVCVCSVKMLPDELVSLVGHCGRIYSTPTPDSLTRIYESDWEGGGGY